MATLLGRLRSEFVRGRPASTDLYQGVQLAVVVGVPLALGVAAGRLPAGVIASIGGMMGTLSAQINGGTMRLRIGTILATVLAVIAGAAFGTLVDRNGIAGGLALFTAAFVAGRVHGAHPVVESVARFLGIGVAIGVGLRPDQWIFAAYYLGGAAFAVAMAWLVGRLDPSRAASQAAAIRSSVSSVLRREVGSTRFALLYASTVVVALLTASWLGVTRPYWAALTVFLVMRMQTRATLSFVSARTAGTLVGVAFAGLFTELAHLEPERAALAVAFAFAVPLGRRVGPAFGITAITAVVMLLIDLLPAAAAGGGLFTARLYDTLVACVLVLLGSSLDALLAGYARNRAPG
jgi:uncharacterized membrane protein YccC